MLEFAYELDYDKFMEDQEIKLAFEVIRDRVADIKKDQDWKEQLANEWNEETEKEKVLSEKRSVYSYRSNKSKKSYMEQVKEKKAEKEASEWDRTTVVSGVPRTVEEKLASKIASQMLIENPKLKGVHSNMSLKKILEKEAKRQLLAETGG